jgi:DNA-binding transcriptional MocR family regulator
MQDQTNSQSTPSGLKRQAAIAADALVALIGPWADGADPLNEQLAAALGRAIEVGLLPPGTRLPAERELARALALSRTTIVAAYDRLRLAGLARSRQGSGTRVAARPPGLFQPYAPTEPELTDVEVPRERMRSVGSVRRTGDVVELSASAPRGAAGRDGVGLLELHASGDDVVSLTVGALPANPVVAEAVQTAMREDVPSLLGEMGYDPFGLPALRAALADHMARLGVPTHPDELIVTSGAQQACHLIASQLGGPGTAVAMENPTYIGAIDAFRTTGNRLLPVPLDADGLRVEVLGMLAGSAPLRLAYVVPTFHNPTAATMPEDRRRELVRLAGLHGFQVVEDLTPDASLGRGVPPPIAAFDPSGERVLTIGSLSKLAWGGLRIGWVRAARPDIDRLVAAKIVADHSTSLITQAIAVRVLERVDEVAAATEAEASERRAVLLECLRRSLPEWGWRAPDGGLSLWVQLPDADAVAFSRLAANHGVIVRPGPLASPDGGFRDHIRLAYGSSPDQIREGVERLARAWAAYSPAARSPRSGLAVSV